MPTAVEAAPSQAPTRRRPGRPRGATSRLLAGHTALGRHHFGFLRAVIQGVSRERAWSTYLAFSGGAGSERHIASTERTLRRALHEAAQHRGLGPIAQLALSDPSEVPSDVPTEDPDEVTDGSQRRRMQPPRVARAGYLHLPTLTEYVERRCAEFGIEPDFQSQQEWMDEYRQAYGLDGPARVPATALADPGPAEHTGAIEHRLAALSTLETALARRPALADPLEAWLSRSMARVLRGRAERPALHSLADLIDFANRHGNRWWVKVPALGRARAERLIAWLAPLAAGLQRPIAAMTLQRAGDAALARRAALAALEPASTARFGLVPLDRLVVPPPLDGREGVFRTATPNTFGASTDLEAIQAWLHRYARSPRTHASYASAVERFYLWCLLERRKPLSSLVEEDLHAWRHFMASPPAAWVQPRHVERESDDWRPFRGPLGAPSQRHNLTVIRALLSSLVPAGYLTANAANGVMPLMKLPRAQINQRRSFTEAQWGWILRTWEQLHADCGPGTKEPANSDGRGVGPSYPPPTPADPAHPDRRPARARELRRLRLILELGASTGLRRLEIATARMGNLTREVFEGQPVWMLQVLGKGSRARRVHIPDDIKQLIDQHQQDMVDAKVGIDHRAPLRELVPSATTAEGLPEARMPLRDARPLVGVLRVAPPRWRTDKAGAKSLDHGAARQADRFGALDPNALGQSLKRLFGRAAATAHLADPPLVPGALASASTHWLRHFFANNAVADGVELQVIRAALGHSDLKTTSVYINPEEVAVVRGLSRMRRRG